MRVELASSYKLKIFYRIKVVEGTIIYSKVSLSDVK